MSEHYPEPGIVNSDGNSSTCNQLCPVNKLPEKYGHIFSNYEYFNKIQTKAFDTILYTDKSIVVSAPTGSGKTVIFELAVIRLLQKIEKYPSDLQNSKIIYVAPIKALCSERHRDWTNKFSNLGLKCIEITGDTEHSDDILLITNNQLIITTPEKWDSLTRRCKELKCWLYNIKLFLIDEVHLINDGNRGATLETIVSRMKIISKIINLNYFDLRFVAVSATASNIDDIAKWLTVDQNHTAHYFISTEDDRPVKLQKIVLGYDNKFGGFKFDLDLTYKLKPLITQYSNGRPTLIFCSTRKSVEFTCNILIKGVNILLSDDLQKHISEFSKEINNNKLKEMLKLRIGCHHAGMSFQERSAVENLFRMGCLLVLVATSTLAMGVNLPAHLVIIKSTEYYNFNSYKEYNEFQIMQMIGRAGRPQFDTTATAIIMTKNSMKRRYEQILVSNHIVESHLHKHLIEHLNAEIFLGTIHDVTVAMNWIRSTFLYVRVCRSPQNYGLTRGLNVDEVECRLQSLCLTEIKSLADSGLINFLDGSNTITSKSEGEIMAKHLLSFATTKSFTQLKGTENLKDMLKLLTCAKEFECIKLRRIEKGKLNILNKNKSQNSNVIRFPIEEGIHTREAKVNCLLQATLGTLKISDTSLAQDANTIILISTRLTKALKEITFRGTKFEAARVACILAKCVTTRLWEQSKFVSKLIPKVGPVLAGDFVLNGKTTLKSIRDTDPRDIERFLNRNPPFGKYIHDFIRQIPKYKIYTSFKDCFDSIFIKITLMDHYNISTTVQYHTISILVGDSENRLLKIKLIRNKEFLEHGGTVCMTVSKLNTFCFGKPDYTVTVCLISDQWVGTDIEFKLKPRNGEDHIVKESMSEENIIYESPLKTTVPSTRPVKKRTSKVVKPKQTKNKEKTQVNIKKYMHNIFSKDQDSKITRLLCEEKGEDTTKCGANESNVATQGISGEIIETPNSQNNEQISEYFKLDKDNSNKCFYYHELINDDVFKDLFVADDNLSDISKASDSITEKCFLKENENQTKNVKNSFRRGINETIQLQHSRDQFLHGSLENKETAIDHKVSAKDIMGEIYDEFKNTTRVDEHQYGRSSDHFKTDPLENKENNDLQYTLENKLKKRLPFDVLQQDLSNRRIQKSPKQFSDKFDVNKKFFTDDHSKQIRFMFLSRTPTSSPRNIECGSGAARHHSNTNSLTKKLEFAASVVPTPAAVSRSQRIETNLKATDDGRARPSAENLSETGGKKGPKAPGGRRSEGNCIAVPAKSRRLDKLTLDKYFNVTKFRQNAQQPRADRFVVNTASSMKNSACPDSGRLDRSTLGDRDEPLFSQYFSNHDECSKNDSENLFAGSTGRQYNLPYFAPAFFRN